MNQRRRLEELLSEWDNRRTQGRELSPEELCKGQPELLPSLQRRIEEVQQLERLAQRRHSASDGAASPARDQGNATPQQGQTEAAHSGLSVSVPGDPSPIKSEEPADRDALPAREGGDEAEMHQCIKALLEANDRLAVKGATSADLSPGPWVYPANMNPPTEGTGSRIGPYKLLQQVGEGGMGVVYMAEQEQPVRRKVALKIIKPGMDSSQVIARFEAERQALAMMDHQNIARVLDAGTTASGRPYFVMELVKGIPITKFCDGNHLAPRERLELFVPICQAIQHAHQKGIIHRDIKPSNVLVTLYDGKPVPKIIDFGVAKATQQRLTERTLFTQFGQVVGTLEYMSPEQAEMNALDIDTRSDIYSLGVVLYELLTGTTPLEKQKLRSAAFTEMLRMVREEEPPKPSVRLIASRDQLPAISAQRKTEPAKLKKLVRGELDWIVMKALEKDRGRRYSTANGLARDIERYLRDEPVEACPPSAAYRVRKFSRKNRRALALAGAFMLLLAAAALVSTGQAIRATRAETKARQAQALSEERFDMAKEAVDKYLNEITETPELKNANFEGLRKRLLETALLFYQKLVEQDPSDPQQESARGWAYQRLGGIYWDLSEFTEALAHYEAMRVVFARLAEQYPNVPDYRKGLGSSHQQLGRVLTYRLGKPSEAEVEYRAAIKVYQRLAHEYSNVPDYQSRLARSRTGLGSTLLMLGKHEEAEAEYRAAIQASQRLTDEHPNVPSYRYLLAHSQHNLGILLENVDKSAEAEVEYRSALKDFQRLADGNRNNRDYLGALLSVRHNLGGLLVRLERLAEAEAEFHAELAVWQRVMEINPNLPEHRSGMAHYHRALGDVLSRQGKRADAEVEFRAALAIDQKLAGEYPNAPQFRNSLASSHGELGALLAKEDKAAEAESEFRAAIKELQRLANAHPNIQNHHRELADRHLSLGALLADLGKRETAEAEYRAVIADYQRLAGRDPKIVDDPNAHHRYLAACAAVLVGCGRWKDNDKLNTTERKRLRRQALDWLQADLQAYGQMMDQPADKTGPATAQRMQHWLKDDHLATVRGSKTLANLSQAERKEWQKLWEEVEALRQRATQKSKTTSSARP